jgi:hypothetical protein
LNKVLSRQDEIFLRILSWVLYKWAVAMAEFYMQAGAYPLIIPAARKKLLPLQYLFPANNKKKSCQGQLFKSVVG